MKVKYYDDREIEKNRISIFLAGPTPRSLEVKSWRPEAIKILNQLGFDGDVFVPEFEFWREGEVNFSYIVDWELEHLDRAGVICFWVPRELKVCPVLQQMWNLDII